MTLTSKLVVCLLLLTAGAFADPVIDVYTALAPNGYGSPSYAGWRSNAIYALMNDLSSYGDPSLPTFYQRVSGAVSQQHVQVTSFKSWLGTVDPGTAFGPAFANELGNRLLFGLRILGNGTQFSISQLSFTMASSDPENGLGWTYATGTYNYSADYVGVLFGANGQLGGGDDTLVTSGANTQMVDALFGRGSGNAYWPCAPADPAPCSTLAEQQAAIDEAAAYNSPDPYTFTGTYTLETFGSGTASVAIVPTPEPSSVLLLSGVLCAAGMTLRRRMRKT